MTRAIHCTSYIRTLCINLAVTQPQFPIVGGVCNPDLHILAQKSWLETPQTITTFQCRSVRLGNRTLWVNLRIYLHGDNVL